MKSLGDWLAKVEDLGELARIEAEVDPNLEMSTITYLSGKQVGGPTLLFENIQGRAGFRVLFNPFGSSYRRLALTVREDPGTGPIDLARTLAHKMRARTQPVEVDPSIAPVNQNIEMGDDVDVTKFGAPVMWPRDGGAYIGTADVVLTMDPNSNRINLGTYRQMIEGPNQVGFYASPGKDALLDRELWWSQGKPAPVAAVYGCDPLLYLTAATTFPKDVSEYELAGGIAGEPIEVFTSEITGLKLPANAEIIIEGFSYPDRTAQEGPFGEFQGYYGRPGGPTPFIEVTAIRYRNNPILMSALMADWPSNEAGAMWGLAKSAKVWSDLESMGVPGIRGVWSPPEAAGWGWTVVSIEQKYAGHAAQVGALAAQCMGGAYFTKYIVVVDEDVDPTSLAEVIWAMATRSRPKDSIDILRETWSTYLDPSQNPPENRPWGSKCIINACKEFKYIKDFARRTRLDRSVYEKVAARWQELGLKGEAPTVGLFEEEGFGR